MSNLVYKPLKGRPRSIKTEVQVGKVYDKAIGAYLDEPEVIYFYSSTRLPMPGAALEYQGVEYRGYMHEFYPPRLFLGLFCTQKGYYQFKVIKDNKPTAWEKLICSK